MSIRILIALLCAGASLACGGSTSQDSSTGGSPGTGGASGGAGGVGGSAGSSGGSAGASCDDFADETPPGAITFRYQNATSVPIYLGGSGTCYPVPLYELAGPHGPVPVQAGECGHTCQALQTHGNYCTDACMLPPVVMIIPGGHYEESWSGATHQPAEMPPACYFEPEFAPKTCDRRLVAPEGSYAVAVHAGTELTCLDVGICGCQPDAKGSCKIPHGGSSDAKPLTAKASFTMPGASVVVVTFE